MSRLYEKSLFKILNIRIIYFTNKAFCFLAIN